jgi:hypothetical protein
MDLRVITFAISLSIVAQSRLEGINLLGKK